MLILHNVSSYWYYSLVPTLTAPTMFLHSILFVALVFQLWAPGIYSCWVNSYHSILLASLGVSWQGLFYRVRELASFPTTDWWIRPLYLFPLETGWPSCTLGHWVPILVTSVTCMDYVGAVLFLVTTWELHNVYHWCKNRLSVRICHGSEWKD